MFKKILGKNFQRVPLVYYGLFANGINLVSVYIDHVNPISAEGAQISAPLWKITRCMSNFAAGTLCFTDF